MAPKKKTTVTVDAAPVPTDVKTEPEPIDGVSTDGVSTDGVSTDGVSTDVVSIDGEITPEIPETPEDTSDEDYDEDEFEFHDDERYDQIFGVIAASLQTSDGAPLADVMQDIHAALDKHNAIAEDTNKILFRIAKLLTK